MSDDTGLSDFQSGSADGFIKGAEFVRAQWEAKLLALYEEYTHRGDDISLAFAERIRALLEET